MAELRITGRGNGRKSDLIAGLVETDDGAHIYVEQCGQGRPLVLLHGWTMSSGFWRKQSAGLKDRFRVAALDLRGHGNSSKVLHGHTIPDYARDLRAVIEALELDDIILGGWSLAGPVVLDYMHRFSDHRVSGLMLVECTPAPMSPEPWNTHVLQNHNFIGLHASFAALRSNRVEYGKAFIRGMFQSGQASDEDLKFMLARHLQTPTDPARAIYSDYAMRDLGHTLPGLDVPVLAVFGSSEHTCFGPKLGRYLAETIPDCRTEIFEHSGHMPFWEEPDRFNRLAAEFSDHIGR